MSMKLKALSKCLSKATALVEVDPQFETRFSTKALFQFRAYYTSPSNVTQHPDLEPTRSGGAYHLMGGRTLGVPVCPSDWSTRTWN